MNFCMLNKSSKILGILNRMARCFNNSAYKVTSAIPFLTIFRIILK